MLLYFFFAVVTYFFWDIFGEWMELNTVFFRMERTSNSVYVGFLSLPYEYILKYWNGPLWKLQETLAPMASLGILDGFRCHSTFKIVLEWMSSNFIIKTTPKTSKTKLGLSFLTFVNFLVFPQTELFFVLEWTTLTVANVVLKLGKVIIPDIMAI